MKNYLILSLKLSLYYKFWLENVLRLQELKSLKNGRETNSILIEEPIYKLKKLSWWKHKEWKLHETDEERRLKDEHFSIERQKTKDTEDLSRLLQEIWLKICWRTSEEILSMKWGTQGYSEIQDNIPLFSSYFQDFRIKQMLKFTERKNSKKELTQWTPLQWEDLHEPTKKQLSKKLKELTINVKKNKEFKKRRKKPNASDEKPEQQPENANESSISETKSLLKLSTHHKSLIHSSQIFIESLMSEIHIIMKEESSLLED